MSKPKLPVSSSGSINGIILLDKPQGLSSNTALQKVKRALGARKAGHAGTLDPLATGMLPILLGEATKVAGHLLHKDKAYQVVCRLGQSTDTYDAEGKVTLERPVLALQQDEIVAVLPRFTGRIQQQAPAYSAIKQGGQPLYKRARRGEEVQAPVREVEIRRIEIESWDGIDLSLNVECGSGTYIRSLAHDLGEVLGCGAHVLVLRRLWVSPFCQQPMCSLESVLAGDVSLVPILDAMVDWPRLALSAGELERLSQGQTLDRPNTPVGRLVGIAPDGRLAALLEAGTAGRIRVERLLLPD